MGYTRFYRLTLQLYPATYRQEYESEMVELFADLLHETRTTRQRVSLLLRTTLETFKWATPELTTQLESNVAIAPYFIKLNSCLSIVCIGPFVIACLYHLHRLYDHDSKPRFLNLLVRTHALYAIALPTIGLVIAISTILWSLVRSKRYWHVSWIIRLQTAWHNSLLAFGLLGIICVAILS